jgi:hypothetical protein
VRCRTVILFLVFLLILCFLFLFIRIDKASNASTDSATVAPEIFARAHRYHGISFSQKDQKGWFFIRDGKRCKVFTQACLERIGR